MARRTVLVPVVVAAVLAAAPVSAADPIADLTVRAFGAQHLDLASGFTELLDGGEVVDRSSGVRLVAPWLRYSDLVLEAREAVVEGAFGRLYAERVAMDLSAGVVAADGGVLLERDGAPRLRAERVDYIAGDGWAVARGDVEGEAPGFTAAAVWADLREGRVLLVAPYRYQDGPFTLRSDVAGTHLQLTPIVSDAGAVIAYDASTELDADALARVEAGAE